LALLVALVLLMHLCLAEGVQRLRAEWAVDAAPMPPRLTVAYVRAMTPVIIKPATSPAAPMPQAPAIATAEAPPAPASAPLVAEVEPAPTPEPAPKPEPAASAVAAPAVLAQAEPDAESDAEPGPEWPLSTRLEYTLTGNYRGEVHGDAAVEWIRRGRHYQVHLDLHIGPRFAPLISRRMSSDGELGPRGIAPKRYDEDTRVLFTTRKRVSVLFQGEHLTLAKGEVQAAPAGVQDAASQFVQLTWLFLTGRERMSPGHVVEIPLALPKRQYRWRYEVLGEQELATPMGPLATWHLKPSQPAYGGDLSAEVWLAPSLQYLPVRLRVRQDADTYIDLMIKSAPLQESIVQSTKETP